MTFSQVPPDLSSRPSPAVGPGVSRWAIAALAIANLVLLASWLPQYLTWPWWADPDAFACLAQAWDAGALPYRDVAAFNFPGPIYLFWCLGKLFGWGHTVPFYAVDGGLVVVLGVALLAWSKRAFGSILAGQAGYAAFLGHYLSLDYTQVAQRDWHAPLFIVLALLALLSWPGRAGWIASAMSAAVAVTIRPHVVVLLPAVAMALAWRAHDSGHRGMIALRAVGKWGLVFAAAVLVTFLPLILSGIFGDFVRGIVRTAVDGQYSRATWAGAIGVMRAQLQSRSIVVVFLVVMVAAIWPWRGPLSPAARSARLWSLAFLGAFFYKPIHPVYHDYLDHPLWLVWSVNVAVVAAVVNSFSRVPMAVRSSAIVAMTAAVVGGVPLNCSLDRSLEAPSILINKTEPVRAPLGYARRRSLPNAACYPWSDYRAALVYLRRTTGPSTRVANVLKGFPAVNGPVGRLSPFPIESGLVFVWLMGRSVEDQFAAALKRTPDSVVVWIPDEDGPVRIPLDRLSPLIRELYRPEARFGTIEVWRRREMTTTQEGM